MMRSSDIFKTIMSQYTDEDNPLQDTFLIKVTDIEKIAEVADAIKNLKMLMLLNMEKEWLNN